MEEAEESALDALISTLSRVWLSADYADFTIRCGGREWKMHKVIVASQSDFFKKATDGAFKEGLTGVIELKDEKPDHIERLVQYLYTAKYNDVIQTNRTSSEKSSGETVVPSSEAAPMTHVIMYSLADKYNIAGLKDLSKQKFIAAAQTSTANDALWDALEAIENTTPSKDRGLRDAAIILIRRRFQELATQNRFDSYLHKHAGVAAVLLKKAYSDQRGLVDVDDFINGHVKLNQICPKCSKTTPIDVHYLQDQRRHLIRCGLCRHVYR